MGFDDGASWPANCAGPETCGLTIAFCLGGLTIAFCLGDEAREDSCSRVL